MAEDGFQPVAIIEKPAYSSAHSGNWQELGEVFMRTQVGIIGAGPSGLLLSLILHNHGISSVVLERRSREYVLSRIRAGVLEQALADMLRKAGVGKRMDAEGEVHDGVNIAGTHAGARKLLHIDLKGLTGGKSVMVYGQTEITQDLYQASDALGGMVLHEAANVTPHEVTGSNPFITYSHNGQQQRLDCDFIAGCDGFHGISRSVIPDDVLNVFEKTYPFGWLGVLSRTPPVNDELIYCKDDDGFALCSMRSRILSRYYVQCSINDTIDRWPDERFWQVLGARLPEHVKAKIITGPSIEKSIAPLRSFVAEPMRYGRLFLVGDAAHIVPPTGAKGLNLAASDVHYLSNALIDYFRNEDEQGIMAYSATALRRVWKAERFSWWMTRLLHHFDGESVFDQRIQQAEFDLLCESEEARRVLALNYVGLPY